MKDDYCLPAAWTVGELKIERAFYQNPLTVNLSLFYK